MKKVLILGGMAILIVLGGWSYLMAPNEIEVKNLSPEVITETKIVKEDVIQARVTEAQEAERERIENEANTMRDDFVKNEMTKIESRILREAADELDARAEEKEKETGDY